MGKQLIELTVDGMDCAHCAASISRYLERKGLDDVYVNFQTREVRYSRSPGNLDEETVKAGIRKLGYIVVEPEQKPPFWSLTRKMGTSAFFTLPLLIQHVVMSFGWSLGALDDPWVQLFVCLPVYTIGVLHFGVSAWKSLRSGVPNMDVLIFIGSTAAFAYSLIGTITHIPAYIFYETTATIITLVLVGNWLEKRAVDQTTHAIKALADLQVERARRVMPTGTIMDIRREEIQLGFHLQVNEGDKVPADGRIISGQGHVDESMITGESQPVFREKGESVIGTSIVVSGNFQIVVERLGRDSVLGKMIELVKTAQQDKPAIQRLADQISNVFVPVVLAISLLTFGISWLWVGIPSQQAAMHAIAVLVISCPCAMGLATPTAVMVGVGRLARRGVLIRGGQTVESLAKIKTFVFDKTGTLTTGKLQLDRITYQTPNHKRVHALIHAQEMHSTHPIAKSLVREMSSRPMPADLPEHKLGEQKGKGMTGTAALGNTFKLETAPTAGKDNPSADLWLTENDTPLAYLTLSDQIRPQAKAMVDKLKNHRTQVIILSGDRAQKTQQVAHEVGVDTYYMEQLPEEKLDRIRSLTQLHPTAMVGDGINDAPALAKATLGISLTSASEVALQSAKVVLLNADLSKLPEALAIARATVLTIKQNLFWAFAYNIVAIPIAALGFLNPMWGALFMAFSDVIVIGNSIRLRHKKIIV
ncbi:MAG: cadmium-translocating P-type ATPase [Saprospiraceae bacterium]|nr:cadmium-translocating P-type ATPase [Saprospiraceae bacterium]